MIWGLKKYEVNANIIQVHAADGSFTYSGVHNWNV